MHGIKFTDEQFEQMMNNLNPDTIRQGTEMAKNNPDMLKRAQETQNRVRNN
jgi:hypothetical protein